MGNARAQRRRLARRAHRPILPDATYGVQPAWCASEAELGDARAITHDALIAQMGNRRIAGVQWLTYTGDDAVRALGKLREGAVGEHADYYRRLGGHLREYGGFLVVAIALGKPA